MANKKLESILLNDNRFVNTVNVGLKNTFKVNTSKLKTILNDNSLFLMQEADNYFFAGKDFFYKHEETPCKENLYKARDMYNSLFNRGYKEKELFLNYGELLSIIGDYSKAIEVYEKGLIFFKDDLYLKNSIKQIKDTLEI